MTEEEPGESALPSAPADLPTAAQVDDAALRLEGVAHRTPVMTSRTFDDRVQGTVFFKCENLQRSGSFKFRGAFNAVSRFRAGELEGTGERGIVAFSSGNHAQAIALASKLLSVEATVVMPEDAPRVKLEATIGYGAEVITYDRETEQREEVAARIAAQRGLTVIPAYDHPAVISGQGTVAHELHQQVEDLDCLLVCLGGGGLLSGCALASRAARSGCEVIGVEPANADDAARSFHTGRLHTVHNPDTIADGARTPSLGRYTFPLIREHVDDVVTVSEEAIVEAMRMLWTRAKLVVEPTGALAAAALLCGAVAARGRRIGVVLSGGNVDLARALALMTGSSR